MQTIAIECSDTAYAHILYFLENLPKSEITKQAINRLETNNKSVETYKTKDELFEALGL